jgi:hypothetical protein
VLRARYLWISKKLGTAFVPIIRFALNETVTMIYAACKWMPILAYFQTNWKGTGTGNTVFRVGPLSFTQFCKSKWFLFEFGSTFSFEFGNGFGYGS